MDNFPFVGPGGLKEAHRREAEARRQDASLVVWREALADAVDNETITPQQAYMWVLSYDNR